MYSCLKSVAISLLLFVSVASSTTYVPISVGDITVIIPINDVPIASDASFSTDEDETAEFDLTPFIEDEEVETTTIAIVSGSSNGNSLSVSGQVVSFTPTANWFGTDTFTYQVTDVEGEVSDTVTVTITVNAVNDAPTISDIDDQSVNEDNSKTVTFTIADIETTATSLIVTLVSSSNTSLLPTSNISLGGSDSSRTVTLTPASNQNGSSTITLQVTDSGGLTATESFVLTVNSVNDAPSISSISNQSVDEDNSKTVNFTISDIETATTNLSVAVESSSNISLLPTSNISLGGSDSSRTVTLTPASNQNGSSTIALQVTDGSGLSTTESFVLTVNSVNDAPTISSISNQSVNEDNSKTVNFTVSDIETAATRLSVALVSSSNTSLLPTSNISLGGSGSSRNMVLTPVPNQYGNSTVLVRVTDDGGLTTTQSFVLIVDAVNDAPTISAIDHQTVDEDNIKSVNLAIGDSETSTNDLTLSADVTWSSNDSLLPESRISFEGSGGNRIIILQPEDDQSGRALIKVTVTDEEGLTDDSTFALTVNEINDPPIANYDGAIFDEGEERRISVLSDDIDPEGGGAYRRFGNKSYLWTRFNQLVRLFRYIQCAY